MAKAGTFKALSIFTGNGTFWTIQESFNFPCSIHSDIFVTFSFEYFLRTMGHGAPLAKSVLEVLSSQKNLSVSVFVSVIYSHEKYLEVLFLNVYLV